jgi:acyl carrier protein
MLDSFDLMELVSPLEDRYGMSVDVVDTVPENIRSAEAIAQLLATYGVKNES